MEFCTAPCHVRHLATGWFWLCAGGAVLHHCPDRQQVVGDVWWDDRQCWELYPVIGHPIPCRQHCVRLVVQCVAWFRPVYLYAVSVLLTIFNIRLCQYAISTLITLISSIKIKFYHVGDFPFQVLLCVDVPFHIFTPTWPRQPFSYSAKDLFACVRHVRFQ